MYISCVKKYMDCRFRYAAGRLDVQEQQDIREGLKENNWSGCRRIFGTERMTAASEELEETEREFLSCCGQMSEQGSELYLEFLMERFALSAFEKHCVRLLFLYEIDTCYTQAAAVLQNGWGYVTPYLAWLTFGDEFLEEEQFLPAFTADSILCRFFLESAKEDSVFCMQRLRLRKRVLDFACGNMTAGSYGQLLRYWDKEETLKQRIGEPEEQIRRYLDRMLQRSPQEQGRICYVYGETGSGRRFSIRHACREKGYSCCQISLDACMQEIGPLRAAQRQSWMDGLLWEVLVFQVIPVFVSEQEADAVSVMLKQMGFFLQQAAEWCPAAFLCMRQKVYLQEAFPVSYLYQRPMTLLEGKKYWEEESRNYPIQPGLAIGSMSNKFRLTPGMISTILKNADHMRIQNGEAYVSLERITEECYSVIARQMGKNAVKVPAVYCMEDLILPNRQKQQLRNVCDQVICKHKIYEEWGFQKKTAYGRGTSVVFAGPPGTGKTMAAQVIARELGIELYKVDLSCVVSKYIGETEKNLNEIFDQAEKSQVILFFDEADALFGKRSEGKESTDKYSNIEAAFLLQKVEGYEGIVILATNLFHHFDEAFKRRMKMVVEFPLPDAKDRRMLWKTMIPQQMPAGEIDFDYLAERFELTGSNIRNILLHSAFLAASKHKAVDMEDIIPAVKNEYAKIGKNLTRKDVSEYYMYLE